MSQLQPMNDNRKPPSRWSFVHRVSGAFAKSEGALQKKWMQIHWSWTRHLQITCFWLRLFTHLLWWDRLCTFPPLSLFPPLRAKQMDQMARWRKLAQAYRQLAIKHGGLLIKVGQHLSLRFDLFPQPVLRELAQLQDNVAAAPFPAVAQVIEADLGQPLATLFHWISPQPVASASVAQVHMAELPSGEQVAVKVIRPGVIETFAMDLTSFSLLIQLLRFFPRARNSFDLKALMAEFTAVTARELELVEEGRNAERFAHEFSADPRIHIPKIYWQYSGQQTLTMENVGYLSLRELPLLDAAGIDRAAVAKELAQLIVRQIFVFHFVHADPHPGNIFVKPLLHPLETRAAFRPGEAVPYQPQRPFQIILIDFGMAIEIPAKERVWLREFVIGLGLRDARRIMRAYQIGGILRPNADLVQLEAMTADLLHSFQEMLVGIMPDPESEETRRFYEQHAEILFHGYPFQIPMELLFMYRSLGTMGFVVKQLDPDFELSTVVAPLAIQWLVKDWQTIVQDRAKLFANFGQLLITSPTKLDEIILQAQRTFEIPEAVRLLFSPPAQEQQMMTVLATEDRRNIQQLERSVRQLNRSMMVLVGLIAVGVFWYISLNRSEMLALLMSYGETYGFFFMIISSILLLWNWIRGGPLGG